LFLVGEFKVDFLYLISLGRHFDALKKGDSTPGNGKVPGEFKKAKKGAGNKAKPLREKMKRGGTNFKFQTR